MLAPWGCPAPQPAVPLKLALQQMPAHVALPWAQCPLASVCLLPGHSRGHCPATSFRCSGLLSQQCQGAGRAWPSGGNGGATSSPVNELSFVPQPTLHQARPLRTVPSWD